MSFTVLGARNISEASWGIDRPRANPWSTSRSRGLKTGADG